MFLNIELIHTHAITSNKNENDNETASQNTFDGGGGGVGNNDDDGGDDGNVINHK